VTYSDLQALEQKWREQAARCRQILEARESDIQYAMMCTLERCADELADYISKLEISKK
jgi:hypothetical protein